MIDVSVFKGALPYRHFKSEDWQHLKGLLREASFPSGGALFKEGDPGDGLYFIRSGRVTVQRLVEGRELVLAMLGAGVVVGEMALAGDDKRSADAVCSEGAVLYHLGGAAYETLKREHPGSALRLQDLVVVTLCSRLRASKVKTLRSEKPMPVDVSIFRNAQPYRGLRDADWKVLSEAFQEERVPGGNILFREGDRGNGLYFVRSGHVKILRRVTQEGRREEMEQLLTVLDAGHLFGEMALIDGDTRSADAVAEGDAVLYHLPDKAYLLLKKDHPDTALRLQDLLVNTLCARLRAANKNFEIIKFWLT